MCFGTYYSKGRLCQNCKVIRSCKKESLKRINNEQKRHKLQKIKTNTLSKYGNQANNKVLQFLTKYKKPISTYMLTKEFKKQNNLNVSDTKILQICRELEKKRQVKLRHYKNGRYWQAIKNN